MLILKRLLVGLGLILCGLLISSLDLPALLPLQTYQAEIFYTNCIILCTAFKTQSLGATSRSKPCPPCLPSAAPSNSSCRPPSSPAAHSRFYSDSPKLPASSPSSVHPRPLRPRCLPGNVLQCSHRYLIRSVCTRPRSACLRNRPHAAALEPKGKPNLITLQQSVSR